MSERARHTGQPASIRHLTACLAVIQAQLARCTPDSATRVPDDDAIRTALGQVEHIADTLTRAAPIDTLCELFGLTPFERNILLLCAGVELDRDIASACAAIQGSATPTFGLALLAFPDAAWGALAADAPLRRWQFVELGPGDSLVTRPLRIDDAVLHYLLGIRTVEERLLAMVEPVTPQDWLAPSQRDISARIAHLWCDASDPPVISLCTLAFADARAIVAQACDDMGLHLWTLSADDIPDSARDQATLARLWERQAALTGCVLLLESDSDSTHSKAARIAERVRSLVVVSADTPIRLRNRPIARIAVERPQVAELRARWTQSLSGMSEHITDEIDAVIAQFQFGGQDIEAVASTLRADPSRNLWSACRVQARPKLDELAQHISSRVTWDDLILGARQTAQLREIATQVRHRAQVYDRWGFASRSSRGLSVSALFAGPSGTGKTTAAEVLANELDLDLYRIDLSAVVSKYIGETEKNLRRVFDAAEHGAAILLFDEADALFGKRSDVKDSHDRYANMEVSYLLQRIEAYRGLAILTSNLRDSIDTAFARRIRFIVEFPFPSADDRAAMWRRVFPADAPTRGLDPEKLARLAVSGGSIRNIAVMAAFLAAGDGQPIHMAHVRQAARSELAKLERPIQEQAMRDWI